MNHIDAIRDAVAAVRRVLPSGLIPEWDKWAAGDLLVPESVLEKIRQRCTKLWDDFTWFPERHSDRMAVGAAWCCVAWGPDPADPDMAARALRAAHRYAYEAGL